MIMDSYNYLYQGWATPGLKGHCVCIPNIQALLLTDYWIRCVPPIRICWYVGKHAGTRPLRPGVNYPWFTSLTKSTSQPKIMSRKKEIGNRRKFQMHICIHRSQGFNTHYIQSKPSLLAF